MSSSDVYILSAARTPIGKFGGVFASLSAPELGPAFTINQSCASGLEAILLGADAIRLGRARRVLVGGHEVMSRTPYYLPRVRWGLRMGHAEVVDGMTQDGFLCLS